MALCVILIAVGILVHLIAYECPKAKKDFTMNGHERAKSPMLQSITAKNLLSFGPEGVQLDMKPLNVLVGPNASGKSNLLEAIALLRAAPSELAAPVRSGGGVRNWIWQGRPKSSAVVESLVSNPRGKHDIRHRIEFAELAQRFELIDERVENDKPDHGESEVFFFYRFQDGSPVISVKGEDNRRNLQRQDVALDESILSQRKDPDQFPELAHLSRSYEQIRLYRQWEFGRGANIRDPQRIDVRPNPLMENFSNLGMFLNRLRQTPRTKANFIEKLSDIYEGLTDFEMNFEGGTVQIFFTEGDFAIPATRLSDGSLRYLCLLAMLLDPDPPPLIGIEEPEMGMHPDLIPGIADLLVEASSRCQLVVTTHSDILVDSLTEHYESIVVCEKHEGKTNMRRLSQSELSHWLEKYRLGELWTSGHLGGVRW